MNRLELNWSLIKVLIGKDWQLFQKQLAAYVTAGIFSLCLLGMSSRWSFYLGSLALIVVLVAAACFSISTSLLAERKEQTLAFVMSLPVSPLDFYLAKLLGNLVTFLLPFAVITLGTLAVIAFTPLPDGLFVYMLLIFGQVLLGYSISLSVAMAVESEGWNTFAMIGSMVLINPFIMIIGHIPAIADHLNGDRIVWSLPAIGILLAQLMFSVTILCITGWVHCRKHSFY
jgi:ABC-type transport system involved in multi-copper enzyme maturation permease subunit